MKPSDEFLSPKKLVDLAVQILGHIDYDPYSSIGQLVKARDGLTIDSDPEPWPNRGNFWANIPFSESAEILEKLANHFANNRSINALVLSLAAPSSAYWFDTVWSTTIGCRRIGWVPRMKFLQLDENNVAQPTKDCISRDIALTLWTNEDRLIKRFEQHVPPFNPGVRPRKRPIKVIAGGRP
jgi:hypothetical protein